MYEFTIYNKNINERDIIFGYDFANACKRAKLNPEDCELEGVEYVD